MFQTKTKNNEETRSTIRTISETQNSENHQLDSKILRVDSTFAVQFDPVNETSTNFFEVTSKFIKVFSLSVK
jgi:hypothetical protein